MNWACKNSETQRLRNVPPLIFKRGKGEIKHDGSWILAKVMLNASKLQSSWCCHSTWRPNQYSNAFFFSDLMLQSLPEESSEQRDCVKSFLTSTLSCSGLWGMKSELAESEFWLRHIGPAKPLCSQKKPALCFSLLRGEERVFYAAFLRALLYVSRIAQPTCICSSLQSRCRCIAIALEVWVSVHVHTNTHGHLSVGGVGVSASP